MNIDFDSLNLSIDLLKANGELVQEHAVRAISDFGYEYHEVIVICAAYTDFWKEFIDGLNPEYEQHARSLHSQGLSAVAISVITQADFLGYLREIHADIQIPTEPPRKDTIWSIFLHEKGHGWLQVPLQ